MQIASKSDYLLPDAGLVFLLLGRLCFEQEQLNTVFVFEGLQKQEEDHHHHHREYHKLCRYLFRE